MGESEKLTALLGSANLVKNLVSSILGFGIVITYSPSHIKRNYALSL